jgi:hypothetical protein
MYGLNPRVKRSGISINLPHTLLGDFWRGMERLEAEFHIHMCFYLCPVVLFRLHKRSSFGVSDQTGVLRKNLSIVIFMIVLHEIITQSHLCSISVSGASC